MLLRGWTWCSRWTRGWGWLGGSHVTVLEGRVSWMRLRPCKQCRILSQKVMMRRVWWIRDGGDWALARLRWVRARMRYNFGKFQASSLYYKINLGLQQSCCVGTRSQSRRRAMCVVVRGEATGKNLLSCAFVHILILWKICKTGQRDIDMITLTSMASASWGIGIIWWWECDGRCFEWETPFTLSNCWEARVAMAKFSVKVFAEA